MTGGSKGLGEAMVKALADAGADVIITSRHLEESQAVADKVGEATGRRTLALEMDVSDRGQVERAVERAEKAFGKIDILVNNAGINIRSGMIDLSDEDWHAVIDTNLHGVMYCARAVGKGMIERRYGRIINISSTLGSVAYPNRAAYAASKGGVTQFTKVLALEWAQYNVTANALCPGPFMTEMNKPMLENQALYDEFVQHVPLGRFGDPNELGGAVIFLASDASSFVTGITLFVDGGWTAK